MAIKRDYSTGSKFLYVKVRSVTFNKEERVFFRLEVFEKDSIDAEITNFLYCQDINIMSVDANFPLYFSISKLDEIDTNLIKQCYEYIKVNLDQYRDFIDC
jgi:hypothetical protein